ncbi:MAG: TPM domain-containing protein [Ginsengibacter sp.]
MKLFFTIIILLGFHYSTVAQSAESSSSLPMTPEQIQEYRQFIWDSVPAAVGWVNDYSQLFKREQEDSLEREIERFEVETSVEIMIVTVDSLMVDKKLFDEFAGRLLKLWGIGKIAKSNGIVICISKDYRQVFISADFGIDPMINKLGRQKIIDKYFIPSYEQNEYFKGTYKGLNVLMEKIEKNWRKLNVR